MLMMARRSRRNDPPFDAEKLTEQPPTRWNPGEYPIDPLVIQRIAEAILETRDDQPQQDEITED